MPSEAHGGWVPLYWKVRKSLVYSNHKTFALWCDLLTRAARTRQIISGGTVLEPGQCLISMVKTAKWLEISTRTLQRYFDLLEKEKMVIRLGTVRVGTVVTICNWETYQLKSCDSVRGGQSMGNRSAIDGQSMGTTTDTTNTPDTPESPNKVGATARFSPPSLEEVTKYCLERDNKIDPEQFCDHYEARGWELSKGRKVKSWKACVRTWEKNGIGNNGKPQSEGLPW